MFNGNVVVCNRDMDSHISHDSQSTRRRTAKGFQSSHRSPVQLSTHTCGSVYRTCGYGITERGCLQAHTRLDRIPHRVPQGHSLRGYFSPHIQLVGEGTAGQEATRGVHSSHQQVCVPNTRLRSGRTGRRWCWRASMWEERGGKAQHYGTFPSLIASSTPDR